MTAPELRYITEEEYKEICPNGAASKEHLIQSEHDVDYLTYNRMVAGEFSNFPEWIQNLVKRAISLQADFIHDYGELISSPLQSYGINGVSMSFKSDVVIQCGGISMLKGTYGLLERTGLTNPDLTWGY